MKRLLPLVLLAGCATMQTPKKGDCVLDKALISTDNENFNENFGLVVVEFMDGSLGIEMFGILDQKNKGKARADADKVSSLLKIDCPRALPQVNETLNQLDDGV